MINLSDYHSGGYFLIRAANRPDWPNMSNDLLPDKLLSLDHHLSPKFNVNWGWTTGNPEIALKFGIPAEKLGEFIHWCGEEYLTEMDICCMFYSVETARRLIKRFLPDTTDLYLVGVGLPHEVAVENWDEYTDEETIGVEKYVEQNLPIEPGGKLLGFDVVGYTHNDFECSWLCCHLEDEIYQRFGIRPNQYGLLDTYEQARAIWKWTEERAKQGQKTGHEPYDFWLLISYPLGN